MKRSVEGADTHKVDPFIHVPDRNDKNEFLRSASELWCVKHPGKSTSRKLKEGRPSKEDKIFEVCNDLWKDYKKPPTLGNFIGKIQDKLPEKNITCSANTVRKHVLKWMRSLPFTDLPREMYRRNPSAKKGLELMTALHDKKDLVIRAFNEIASSSRRPFSKNSR